jgi:hypothetical protein
MALAYAPAAQVHSCIGVNKPLQIVSKRLFIEFAACGKGGCHTAKIRQLHAALAVSSRLHTVALEHSARPPALAISVQSYSRPQ